MLKDGDKICVDSQNVTTTAPSKKLADKQLGPFVVKKKISDLNYELDLPDKYAIHPVFHETFLSPYQETTIPGRVNPPPPPIEVEGEEEYVVDRIIDARLWRGPKQYLVQWEGYSPSENTWEPERHLTHATEQITEFHDEHPDFSWKPPKRSLPRPRRSEE